MGFARVAAMLTVGAVLIVGCASNEGAADSAQQTGTDSSTFPRQEVAVPVGDVPPTPEAVGVGDEIEPQDRDTIDLDLATFGARWNEAAATSPRAELVLDEWVVGYAKPFGDFTHEWEDWLVLWGSWSYTTGQLDYAGIDWRFDPEIDGDLMASALFTLLLAVAGADATSDLAADLGLFSMDEQALADGIDTEVVVDGVRYLLYTDNAGGELVVEPA